MSWELYLISALVICATSTFLVVNGEYEDGVVGRIALAMMAVATGLIVAEALVEKAEYVIRPANLAAFVGMAMFMARHVYRFIRWRICGDYKWRKAVK